MKQITVRLDDEVHRKVKMRAAGDGLAMEALGRVWFEAYALGGTVVASTEGAVRSRDGLGAEGGDGTRGSEARLPDLPSAPRPLAEHRADPKDKATQEHGSKQRTTVKGLCPHRVPLGSFCKRCEEGT